MRVLTEVDQHEKSNNAKSVKSASVFDLHYEITTGLAVPEIAYTYLPETLKNLCSLVEESHRRDVFLLATLPVLAAHMPNVLAAHADGEYTPDLFVLVVAPPGTGKGIAAKAKKLGEVLNEQLLKENPEDRGFLEIIPDEKPKFKGLFIPANSSSRAMYDMLEANGGCGLLFETEIDTMLNATSQEWGNFSDVTRKAFHHEDISINRKGELFTVSKPRISIFLSGTTDQFRKMFESAENGHFSRYGFYKFETSRVWKSHKPTEKSRRLEKLVMDTSKKLFDLHQQLDYRKEPIFIELTVEQWKMIDDTFEDLMHVIEDYGLSPYLHASNNRAAVMALRMVSMFAVLRTFEADPECLKNVDSITPTEADMQAALWLADIFVRNAFVLYKKLPTGKETNSKGKRYESFLSKLPEQFQTKEALEIASEMNIPERTVKNWLADLFGGEIERIKHGLYRKVQKS